MNTFISPNLHRTSDRIDPSGNIIDKRTKQVIIPIKEEYVAPTTPPEAPQASTPIVNTENDIPTVSKIDEMINRKIEEIVAKKIEEALSKL